MLAVVLAVTLFGSPLLAAVNRLFYADERAELERLALRGALAVSPRLATTNDRPDLPTTEASVRLGIYDERGRRVAGRGPATGDAAVGDALTGQVSDIATDSDLVVAIPVTAGERVIAVARAASPRSGVQARIRATWAGMLGLAILAGAIASLVAAAQARRLTRPMQELEAVAADLGSGNFAVRARPSGVGEIDRAGDALNQTARRLDDLLSRERAFNAHASHQLRTPLTGLRLGLEAALDGPAADLRRSAEEAMVTADQLSRTIDDVLALARSPQAQAQPIDLGEVLTDLQTRWHGPLAEQGRPLRLLDQQPPQCEASLPAVGQILDVLLDNALHHGAGAVTVIARSSGDVAAIDVTDEGSTTAALLGTAGRPSGHSERGALRLGLALASSLAEAQGGRLVHAHTEERTRLTLLLPAAD